MTFEEYLQDVTIRERQLEAHILRSKEYLRLANRDLKRQVSMIYLAIALLLVFYGFYIFRNAQEIPFTFDPNSLVMATALLAIINCFLLIQTKTWLRRLNEHWLKPEEKVALDTLRTQRQELLQRLPAAREAQVKNAELN